MSNMLLPSLEVLLSVCRSHQKSKQEKLLRKHSTESESCQNEQKGSSSEDEDEPVKKRKRTESEEENSPKSDNSSSPGPSDKGPPCDQSGEEGTKTPSQKVPSKAHQVFLHQRPPLDCVDTLAKALESAISKVPK